MKTKIFSLLAVVALAVAMAVPVFANEVSYTVSGKWQMTENPVLVEFDEIVNFNNGHTRLYLADDGVLRSASASSQANYVYGNGVWGDWIRNTRVFDFGNTPQTVSAVFYEWLTSNGVQLLCDGSTCPATDVNQDNVCDDCGMTFAVLRDYGPPDPYSVWTESKQELYPYALIYTDNSGNDWLLLSKNPATATDGAITIATGSHARYSVFGTSWNLVGSYDEYSTYGNIAEVYPSYNIRNVSGSIEYPYNGDFFPLPLWTQMQMVTQGEMGQLILETVGTTKVLVLCGVGLMALLVVLSLFGKRSLIYRS